MRTLFTSESVTEGHPDKICDQISDAVLDAILEKDPYARVACECATTTGLVMVMGEITTNCYISIDQIARQKIVEIGYDRAKYGFDGESCAVMVAVDEQSSDIAQGVNDALEGRGQGDKDIGAGDQGMMFGYACDETPEYMPMAIALAHRVTRRLAQVRKSGELDYLRPDGKAQVTVEYEDGRPIRVDTVVLSTQHAPEADHATIEKDMIERVIKQVIPAELLDEKTRYRRPPWGFGPDRPQDYCGQLRRIWPSWRRRLLRQGSDQGGPFGGLRGAPCGQEPGGGRFGEKMRNRGGLRHRGGPSGLPVGGQLWHREAARRPAGSGGERGL